MKRTYNLSLCCFLIIWRLQAQSTSEFKINPLLFVENSSPTLVYERTFGKHMAWEVGLMLNEQKAVFGEWVRFTNLNLVVDSFFNTPVYNYARLGGYGAVRWYFSQAYRHRGVFVGLMGAYTEPTFLSPTLKQYFSQIKEGDYKYPYLEKRLLAGLLLGYKQVLWEHWTIEGLVYYSPYLTRQSKIVRDINYFGKEELLRSYGGMVIGYRF